MSIILHQAGKEDLKDILSLLSDMQNEIENVPVIEEITKPAIEKSFDENVFWFLFKNENEENFGCCYMQPVHNYWRAEKRYFLGGLYIQPEYRGNPGFSVVYNLLRQWATNHGGVQIYGHIEKDNERSLRAFEKAGFKDWGLVLRFDHWGN